MEEYMPFIWIAFAVIMAVCEALTSQLVSIWFVAGALCAAITTIFTSSIPIQSAVFLVVSLVALLLTRPLVNKIRAKKDVITTNAGGLVGKTAVLIDGLADSGQVGQAKINGQIWSVKSKYAPLEAGTRVKVLEIEGVKLIVEPEKTTEGEN